jgi:glyoxylase-like metal-dependent hydrolase (beta-lactamase superfamily II)
MLVKNLSTGSTIYTANAYLFTVVRRTQGERTLKKHTASDTGDGLLIDTGCDPHIITVLKEISVKTGRSPFSDIILTHSHYDHTQLLGQIQALWQVHTHAYSAYLDGIDHVVKGGEKISLNGYTFEMIHVPGHSTDSLCIYCPEEEILFSGDTPLVIWGTEGTYEPMFLRAFETLVTLKISTIYPGHGDPVTGDCNRMLNQSLHNLRKSRII